MLQMEPLFLTSSPCVLCLLMVQQYMFLFTSFNILFSHFRRISVHILMLIFFFYFQVSMQIDLTEPELL